MTYRSGVVAAANPYRFGTGRTRARLRAGSLRFLPTRTHREADPWQQSSEAAAVRAQDRDALERAISSLADAAQEIGS